MGEAKRKALKAQNPVAVDTFGGRVHVEWVGAIIAQVVVGNGHEMVSNRL